MEVEEMGGTRKYEDEVHIQFLGVNKNGTDTMNTKQVVGH